MGAFARLKAFAGTRKGKIALGGTAAGGAVAAALVTRHRAGGDPAAADAGEAVPFGIAPGAVSGNANAGAFPGMDVTGVTVDQFDNLLNSIGRLADEWDEANSTRPNTTPAPKPGDAKGAVELHRIGEVGKTYNLRAIAKRYATDPNNPTSVESMLRRIIGANPTLRGRTTLPGGFPLKVPR